MMRNMCVDGSSNASISIDQDQNANETDRRNACNVAISNKNKRRESIDNSDMKINELVRSHRTNRIA